MDKKSILGIVLIGVLFFGFAYISTKEQEQYQQEMAVWQAYQDSVAMAQHPQEVLPVQDSLQAGIASESIEEVVEAQRQQQVMLEGEYLAAAKLADSKEFTVENDVMAVRFSSRGGQIIDVTLKNYTKYAPRNERNELIKLFDPQTANFGMSFYVKRGNGNIPVNTELYNFEVAPIETTAEGDQAVTMRLQMTAEAALEYVYTIHCGGENEMPNDYLVDFDVRFVNMTGVMSKQANLGINWSNMSYQNEKGFKNENMYTTIAYRIPGETAIEELGMSEEIKQENITSSLNWVAFKQQYFSSVFIAKNNLASANLAFETMQPGSEYLKNFSAQMTVPYVANTDQYDFAFYFGPNKYSILNKVESEGFGDLVLERLVPLGWGIFGWVNRWCVIPVFDFLRNYISSFGIIILILVILVKLVISPMTYKSYVSMAKMRLIKPQVDELAKKYPKQEDAMKRQQATMELYKKCGINPMGGCIPMLIQLPILYAMFRFFPASIELRGQAFLWADDLSSFDSVMDLPFAIPFYGDHISLFALLMAISLFGFSYYNYQQTASSQPQMPGMKFMMLYMMPLMMLLWFNSYSSGLCYYYLLSNLFTIGQTLVIRRLVNDDKIQAIMAANAAKKSNGKKSKFQLRYEELMRQQELQQKRNKK